MLEPFLPERMDLVGAQVTSMLFNVNRGKGPPRPIGDFMLVEKMLQRSVEMKSEDDHQHDLMKRVIIGLGGRA